MVYINKTKGVCSTQGVLKRPLKRTICQSNNYKNKGQPIPKQFKGSDHHL